MSDEIHIRPTADFFMVGSVMVRRWEGEADGLPVVAFIAAVCSPAALDEGPGLGGVALLSIPAPGPAEQREWAASILARLGLGRE